MGVQWLSPGWIHVALCLSLVLGCSDVLSLHPSVLCRCQQWGYPSMVWGYLWGRSCLELCRKVPH